MEFGENACTIGAMCKSETSNVKPHLQKKKMSMGQVMVNLTVQTSRSVKKKEGSPGRAGCESGVVEISHSVWEDSRYFFGLQFFQTSLV